MQQVLHLLYLNHRTALHYPESQMMAIPHPHKKVYQPNSARRGIQDEYGLKNRVRHSVNLDDRKRQIQQEEQPRRRKLSRDEVETMKKYIKGYEPPKNEKQYISLPKISKRANPSRQPSRQPSSHYSRTIRPKQLKVKTVKRLTTEQRRMMAEIAKLKFKKCVNAIIFVHRLRQKYSQKAQNFQKMMQLSDNLLEIIDKMINKHYCEVLDVPLLGFSDNLKRKIEKPALDLTYDVVYNILDLSEGLKKTSIRKDLLKFLTLVTLNHARVPHDFFTEFQLLRLDFGDQRFQLVEMIEKRVRMVVGVFMAIKLFCNYIFNHPWDVPLLDVSSQNAKKMEKVIWAYSSYFYYTIISFFQKMPKHHRNYLKILKSKGVEPVRIKEQNDEFYDAVSIHYPKQAKKINQNLAIWINRVSTEVIKNRKNLNK